MTTFATVAFFVFLAILPTMIAYGREHQGRASIVVLSIVATVLLVLVAGVSDLIPFPEVVVPQGSAIVALLMIPVVGLGGGLSWIVALGWSLTRVIDSNQPRPQQKEPTID